MVLFKTSITLLIFCLLTLSIIDRSDVEIYYNCGYVNFLNLNFCFMYFKPLLLGAYTLGLLNLLSKLVIHL